MVYFSSMDEPMSQKSEIVWFNDISMDDLSLVGGKNANLGELTTSMSRSGVPVPPGFAITTKLYDDFIEINQLAEPIATLLLQFDRGENNLSQTGSAIRHLILQAEFSLHQKQLMTEYYNQLCQRLGLEQVDVAVRSSATAEDLPGASFAGQQESYLNIRGPEALILACHKCFASLYTDRAIAYRQEQGFDDQKIALSVGVQQMVRSDLACAGVIFTLDTESGCPSIVLVTGSWGLGETVVKGSVNPDRFMVFKPLLDNGEYLPIIERSCGSKLIKMIYSDKTSTASAVDDIDSSGVTVEIETEPSERYQLILNESEVLQLARWLCDGH